MHRDSDPGGLTGRTLKRLALVPLLLLAPLVLLFGVGVNLPGPPVREWLGLAEPTPPPFCTEPSRVRKPDGSAPAGDWRREPSIPAAITEIRAATVAGRVFIGSGFDRSGAIDELYPFDPIARRFGPPVRAPEASDHTVLTAYGGDLYLLGGFQNSRPLRRFWRYSPETGKWTTLPPLPRQRGAAAGAVIGNRLYVAGGAAATPSNPPARFVRAPAYAWLDIYDFESGRWSEGPDMPTARHHVTAAALDGKLYVVGGRRPGDLSMAVAELYDPRTGRWSALPSLPQGSGAGETVAAAGQVITLGGGDDYRWWRGAGWVTPAVWALAPGAPRWSRLPDLIVARHGPAAAAIAGRLFVFGGSPCPGDGATDAVESRPVATKAGND